MNADTPPRERNALTDPGAWPLLLGLGCVRLLAALPEAWWGRISRVIGGLLWRLAGSRRRVVEINLAIALPDAPASTRAAVARECFERLVLSLIEVGKLWFGPASFPS
ncbi:MAG: lipid A biosynthesis lauroyl acyltransferase, partial [Pseudomonadota bacterium]